MGTINKYIFKQVAMAALMTVALFVFVLVLAAIIVIMFLVSHKYPS